MALFLFGLTRRKKICDLETIFSLKKNITCRIFSIAYNCAMDLSVQQLQEAVSLRRQIDQLQNQLSNLLGRSGGAGGGRGVSRMTTRRGATATTGRRRRRGMSAAGRARIAAAARARWARIKAAGGGTSLAGPTPKRAGRK